MDREVRTGQTRRVTVKAFVKRSTIGERLMGTATDGGNVFKERTRVSGERPIVASGFRQQSVQASCQTPRSEPRTPPQGPCPLPYPPLAATLPIPIQKGKGT